MSDLILLLKSLSKQGLDEYISKQQKEESFPEYVINNINTTGKKITLYNKLLYLYNSKDYSFIFSNLGPYSPDITDEIIELKRLVPKNPLVLKTNGEYFPIMDFLSELKINCEKSGKKIDFDGLIDLSIDEWLKRKGIHK
jgi:hypothetical protein